VISITNGPGINPQIARSYPSRPGNMKGIQVWL
jgi:hypothetical protein